MKFLIDRCVGRRLAAWLVAAGHDAVSMEQLGDDPGDAAILRMAHEEGRILITIDTDFGVLIFRDAALHCGIVRLPDVPVDERIGIMEQLLGKHAAQMEAGAVVTVRGKRVRIAMPPSPGGQFSS